MSAPLSHVAGIPVEETVLAFVPVAALWLALARDVLRRRRD